MSVQRKIERLLAGETIISSEPGHSMEPIIYHRQKHKIAPATIDDVDVGDVVYAKVNGRIYTHKVSAKDPHKGAQISNNRGHINGWTKTIYGKVIEVLPRKIKSS